jgi:hypothetical protein
MKSTFYIFAITIITTSCIAERKMIEKIAFKTDYKFSAEIENKVIIDTVPWKYQLSASDYAAKGDYKNALIHWDLAMGTRVNSFSEFQIDSINQVYSTKNASQYILQKAKGNSVLIINEAHHNSLHRAFTKSLLQDLFDNGYKNLCLEALANGEYLDSALNNRKYPINQTGHYIKDPQFGNLIREALAIGFELFAYETIGDENGKLREIAQAKNIEKIISSKPNEKFIIHCGFDHSLEGTHRSWDKTMAGRLTEYTGLNPFTINQVEYSEKSKSEYNNPLLKALNIEESSILVDKNDTPFKYERGEAWSDIAVFHPNTTYINNRPNWLFKNGNKNVSIPLTDIQIEFPVMVLAFNKEENINFAIPVDITEVNSKSESCNLGLKKGVYQIVITNGKESLKFDKSVK